VGLRLVAVLEGDNATPVQRAQVVEGDLVPVRGETEPTVVLPPIYISAKEAGSIADVMLSRASSAAYP